MIVVLGRNRSLLDRSRRGSRLDILLTSRSSVDRSRRVVDRRGSRSRLYVSLVSSRFSYCHNLSLGSRSSMKSRSGGCCGSNT